MDATLICIIFILWFSLVLGTLWIVLFFGTGIFFFLFAVLGFELKAYTLSHSTIPFFCVMSFFKIGLAGAGFELWILLISAS
jgi:hypothetical protein